MARSIPDGLHSVVPCLVLRDCTGAIDFYRRVFGALEVARIPDPGGHGIGHAELRFGDTVVFLSDELSGGPIASSLEHPSHHAIRLYVDDLAATLARAERAGARVLVPLAVEPELGDSAATLVDPFGQVWSVAAHTSHVALDREREAAADLDQLSAMPA